MIWEIYLATCMQIAFGKLLHCIVLISCLAWKECICLLKVVLSSSEWKGVSYPVQVLHWNKIFKLFIPIIFRFTGNCMVNTTLWICRHYHWVVVLYLGVLALLLICHWCSCYFCNNECSGMLYYICQPLRQNYIMILDWRCKCKMVTSGLKLHSQMGGEDEWVSGHK